MVSGFDAAGQAATTLFTNSISTGVILAGVIQGAVAQSFGHFAVYWVIAAISVVTLVMTGRVKTYKMPEYPGISDR